MQILAWNENRSPDGDCSTNMASLGERLDALIAHVVEMPDNSQCL